MYYLYKEGVYGHGVFWIGEDLQEGKAEADKAATLDKDDYHSWEVRQLGSEEDKAYWDDSAYDLVYIGVRVETK